MTTTQRRAPPPLRRFAAALVCTAGLLAGPAVRAQPADAVLLGGKVVTVDARDTIARAVAIRDGRVLAVGDDAAIRKLAGVETHVIDLGGRTVIPGLIDSHLHAIRAALSFSTEVNWIGARSLEDALGRIRAAARSRPPGSWLIVAGGWNELQFAERRRPTQAELEAAAPANPVYVQLGYGWAVLTDDGFAKLGISSDADLPAGGKLERDASGKPTGAVTGGQAAIIALFDRLPRPTYAEQVEGTKAFFTELNRLGLTGVVDPGGNNLFAGDYQALFDVWRHRALTVRVAYTLNGQTAGRELEELQGLTALLPMGFGDDMLEFNGIGERITLAMNNNPNPSDADKEQYYRVVKWAADHGLSLTMHWGPDATVHHLLDVFERVNREVPIAPLRWSIAHLNDASEQTLARMRALGVGWTVQDAMYFGGDALVRRGGPDAGRRIPPVMTGKRLGVAMGAGTDAHRVASYNPFTALQWFLDGKTVSGAAIRGPEETPGRLDALRLYTLGSAWFSFDDDSRGSLEPGKLADLAVLSADYLTVPVDAVGRIESLLTLVDGKIVYAAGPFAGLRPASH
ncbi:MAG TPA: amidohydrolase [Gammaproteobacteria bacterium]|nr:amidohydrolase [Gammaproteobacteria bacterium]